MYFPENHVEPTWLSEQKGQKPSDVANSQNEQKYFRLNHNSDEKVN